MFIEPQHLSPPNDGPLQDGPLQDGPLQDGRPRPWQYSLRTLLLVVTGFALLCGWLTTVPAPWNWGGFFFFLLIAGHVVGNSLGTSLRKDGDHEVEKRRRSDEPNDDSKQTKLSRNMFANIARDQQSGCFREIAPLHWSYFVVTAVFGVVGGMFGFLAFSHWIGPSATTSGVLVAAGASAVLGGFFGFLASTFLSTFAAGVIEAQRIVPSAAKKHVRSDAKKH